MARTDYQPISWERMLGAVQDVRNRLERAVRALEANEVPYAIVGGNAVAAWVSRVDRAAVRNTRDVDILLDRKDFDAARAALESAGFVYRHAKSIDMFLDNAGAKARDAVHVVFAGEKVKADALAASPSIDEAEDDEAFRVVSLEALVRMKLTAYRDKDRTHLRDLIDLEMIDDSWPNRYSSELGERLQALLDDPDG